MTTATSAVGVSCDQSTTAAGPRSCWHSSTRSGAREGGPSRGWARRWRRWRRAASGCCCSPPTPAGRRGSGPTAPRWPGGRGSGDAGAGRGKHPAGTAGRHRRACDAAYGGPHPDPAGHRAPGNTTGGNRRALPVPVNHVAERRIAYRSLGPAARRRARRRDPPCRPELTDRILIFGERHLRTVLPGTAPITTGGQIEGLRLQPPRPDQPAPDLDRRRIRRRPVLGGLINEYERAD